MSKAPSEAYLSYMYGKNMPSTTKKGKARPREKRGNRDIKGQLELVLCEDSNELEVDDLGEAARKRQFKEDSLAYYDAFYEMLRRYGKFNVYYCLLEALEGEHPSEDAINALNYHYDGSKSNVESALKRSRHWLSESIRKFQKACERVDLFDIDPRFDDAYRNKERREKYYTFIRRERKKVEADKTTLLYTPRDFEDNYQRNRVLAEARKRRKC